MKSNIRENTYFSTIFSNSFIKQLFPRFWVAILYMHSNILLFPAHDPLVHISCLSSLISAICLKPWPHISLLHYIITFLNVNVHVFIDNDPISIGCHYMYFDYDLIFPDWLLSYISWLPSHIPRLWSHDLYFLAVLTRYLLITILYFLTMILYLDLKLSHISKDDLLICGPITYIYFLTLPTWFTRWCNLSKPRWTIRVFGYSLAFKNTISLT